MSNDKKRKLGMFNKDFLDKVRAQEDEWQGSIKGDKAGKVEAVTYSGIPIKPVYSPRDVSEISYDSILFPGQYPYTRGFNPLGYQARPWKTTHLIGYATGEQTRERWEFMRNMGVTGSQSGGEAEELAPAMVMVDVPTAHGFDPDAPEARGRVGACGFSLSNKEDLKPLFDGVPLDKVQVTFTSLNATLAAIALYVAYARERGYSPEQLNMRGSNLLYSCCMSDYANFPPQYVLWLMTECIHYFAKYMPRCEHTSLQGHNIGEVGATGVQEIALMLQLAIELAEEGVRVGLDPDDVMPGFYLGPASYLDFFEQIAKIRVLRKLWASICKERLGCKKTESLKCKIRAQSAGSMYSAQEPYNNIIRGTITTLAGILAGAENIYTTPFDEPLCITTEESQRLAIRTQQIIYHETNIPHVTDPLAGSYYVEWLCRSFEEEVLKYLQEMQGRGGFFKCWETGWIRNELEKVANERQRKIDSGDVVIVGQNKYRLPDEQQPEIELPEFNPEVEQERIAQVEEFRRKRDQGKVTSALAKVREAVELFRDDWPRSCGVLMPAMIDAFEAGATLDEVHHGTLQQVLGYGYSDI